MRPTILLGEKNCGTSPHLRVKPTPPRGSFLHPSFCPWPRSLRRCKAYSSLVGLSHTSPPCEADNSSRGKELLDFSTPPCEAPVSNKTWVFLALPLFCPLPRSLRLCKAYISLVGLSHTSPHMCEADNSSRREELRDFSNGHLRVELSYTSLSAHYQEVSGGVGRVFPTVSLWAYLSFFRTTTGLTSNLPNANC